ncbi:hypothetical protein [Methylomagnum sp.]
MPARHCRLECRLRGSDLVVNSVQHGFGQHRLGGLIRIGASRTPERVTPVYRDDGRGMSADILNQVFEPSCRNDGFIWVDGSSLPIRKP